MKMNLPLPLLLPLAAALFIAVWAGGLGVIFMVLNDTALEEWGAVIIGMSLVVGIPSVAGLLATVKRDSERNEQP